VWDFINTCNTPTIFISPKVNRTEMIKLVRVFAFSAAFAAAYAYAVAAPPTSADLEIISERLEAAEIVPDVIPYFGPSALAYLSFDYKNGTVVALTPGARIGRNGTYRFPA
jgi:hypothetical protein